MRTHHIEGITPLPFDDDIVAIVNDRDHNLARRQQSYVGILNEEGELCRVIVARSGVVAGGVADTLRVLKLNNRIRHSDRATSATDTVTSKPIRTRWHSVMQLGCRPWPIPDLPSNLDVGS